MNAELKLQPASDILLPSGPYQIGKAKLRTDTATVVANAKSITAIITAEDKQNAVGAGRLLQATGKGIAEFYKPFKQKLDEIKQAIRDDEVWDADQVTLEKARLANLVLAWDTAQERARQEEMRQARERAAAEEREARIAEALELAADGKQEEADAVLDNPSMPLPVITQKSEVEKVRGQATRTTYRGNVVDLRKLIQAVAAGKVPFQALQANQSFIDNQATEFREGMDWPGVEVVKEVKAYFRT